MKSIRRLFGIGYERLPNGEAGSTPAAAIQLRVAPKYADELHVEEMKLDVSSSETLESIESKQKEINDEIANLHSPLGDWIKNKTTQGLEILQYLLFLGYIIDLLLKISSEYNENYEHNSAVTDLELKSLTAAGTGLLNGFFDTLPILVALPAFKTATDFTKVMWSRHFATKDIKKSQLQMRQSLLKTQYASLQHPNLSSDLSFEEIETKQTVIFNKITKLNKTIGGWMQPMVNDGRVIIPDLYFLACVIALKKRIDIAYDASLAHTSEATDAVLKIEMAKNNGVLKGFYDTLYPFAVYTLIYTAVGIGETILNGHLTNMESEKTKLQNEWAELESKRDILVDRVQQKSSTSFMQSMMKQQVDDELYGLPTPPTSIGDEEEFKPQDSNPGQPSTANSNNKISSPPQQRAHNETHDDEFKATSQTYVKNIAGAIDHNKARANTIVLKQSVAAAFLEEIKKLQNSGHITPWIKLVHNTYYPGKDQTEESKEELFIAVGTAIATFKGGYKSPEQLYKDKGGRDEKSANKAIKDVIKAAFKLLYIAHKALGLTLSETIETLSEGKAHIDYNHDAIDSMLGSKTDARDTSIVKESIKDQNVYDSLIQEIKAKEEESRDEKITTHTFSNKKH